MEVYLFIYDVKPTPYSPEFSQLKGAHADIYVQGVSFESARSQARCLLMDLGWLVLSTISERIVSCSDSDQMWEGAKNAYRKARIEGISALFLGYGSSVSGVKQMVPPLPAHYIQH